LGKCYYKVLNRRQIQSLHIKCAKTEKANERRDDFENCQTSIALRGDVLILILFPSRAKRGRSLDILNRDGTDVTRRYVTSFSSQTSKARGLKIGMHNPYMDGSITNQFLIFFPAQKIPIYSIDTPANAYPNKFREGFKPGKLCIQRLRSSQWSWFNCRKFWVSWKEHRVLAALQAG